MVLHGCLLVLLGVNGVILMKLPKESLSPDGYINDQIKVTNYMYGPVTVALSGCGPIAAYNALKALGKEQFFENVLEYFNKTTIQSFRLGSTIFQFFGIMRKYGIKMKVHFKKKNFNNADVGILWYKHIAGWHYIMYRRVDTLGDYYFYNAGGVTHPIIGTMEEFLNKYAISKICAVFELKGV